MNRKLTDEIFGLIPALVEQGVAKAEIAARYGVTTNTLQVLCSRRGVSPRKGGKRARRCTLSLPDAPLDLSDTVMAALRKQAKSMGVDEARLASDLLTTIVSDDLYMAVLDTRKEPIAA
jgi:hypothetical protein